MKEHELKCWPDYFAGVLNGRKSFEVRKNDGRDFAVGDILHLCEWDPHVRLNDPAAYTGRDQRVRVTYVLNEHPGLAPGYVVMGLGEVDDPRFCPACQDATGGVCREHRQPECTCYEQYGGGHQAGCDFYVRQEG